jgi:hypothetical protein
MARQPSRQPSSYRENLKSQLNAGFKAPNFFSVNSAVWVVGPRACMCTAGNLKLTLIANVKVVLMYFTSTLMVPCVSCHSDGGGGGGCRSF